MASVIHLKPWSFVLWIVPIFVVTEGVKPVNQPLTALKIVRSVVMVSAKLHEEKMYSPAKSIVEVVETRSVTTKLKTPEFALKIAVSVETVFVMSTKGKTKRLVTLIVALPFVVTDVAQQVKRLISAPLTVLFPRMMFT